MNANTTHEPMHPVCPHCGSDDLICVYSAVVIQGVTAWEQESDGTWCALDYDTADISYDDGIKDVRLVCRTCGQLAARARTDGHDRFELVSPEQERGDD